MRYKRAFAFLLIWMLLVVSICSRGPEIEAVETDAAQTASEPSASFIGENYQVSFIIDHSWDAGYNATITISNTSDTVIENWCIAFPFKQEISNIWNAVIEETYEEYYVIKNADWNQDILPGESVAFGITVCEPFVSAPEYYTLLGHKVTINKENYAVSYAITEDWGEGFKAQIIIENTGTYTIEDWRLQFDYDCEITNMWNGIVLSRENHRYLICGDTYNQDILPNTSTIVEFTVEHGSSESAVSVLGLTEYVNSSSEAEDFEPFIALAGYVEEGSSDLTLVWYSQGSFDNYEIFISKDDVYYTSMSGRIQTYEYVYDVSEVQDKLYLYVKGYYGDGQEVVSDTLCVEQRENQYIAINRDTDGDGLCDSFERMLGTDMNKTDSDEDGLSDYEEFYVTDTHPCIYDSVQAGVSDSDADSDDDGLSNRMEADRQTDAQNPDTDGDGLSDGEEIYEYGTAPLNSDTDDDGVPDGDEPYISLDPLNPETYGIPDKDYITEQFIAEDSDMLSEINSCSNAYQLSVRLKASGYAGHSMEVVKSPYENAIKNDAILGDAIEIRYNNANTVEECMISFHIKEDYVDNTVQTYTDDTKELDGIKRLQVFKYYEDIHMLLPVETDYDADANTVSCHADGMGNYCLMDLQIWLDSMGFVVEEEVDENDYEAVDAVQAYSIDAETYVNSGANACIGAGFVVDTYNADSDDSMEQTIREDMIVKDHLGHVYGIYSGKVVLSWIEAEELCESMGGHLVTINSAAEQEFICKLVSYEETPKYLYWIGGTKRSGIWEWVDKQEFSYTNWAAGEPNCIGNSEYYVHMYSKSGLWNDTVNYLSGSSIYATSNCGFICEWDNVKPKTYYTIVGNNLKGLTLRGELTKGSAMDTDDDGLTDWEEFDSENELLTWEEDGTPVFPSLNTVIEEVSGFSMSSILRKEIYGLDDFAETVRVAPFISDPASSDIDEDGLLDEWDPFPYSKYNNGDLMDALQKGRTDALDKAYEETPNSNSVVFSDKKLQETREKVIILQKCLEYLGYLDMGGAPYGKFGGASKSAVMLYQVNHRMYRESIVEALGVDEATYYSIIKSAVREGYHIDEEEEEKAANYFYDGYMPRSVKPESSEYYEVVESERSSERETIYTYDFTAVLEDILRYGAQEFHFYYFLCNEPFSYADKDAIIYHETYDNSVNKCRLDSRDYWWLYNRVHGGAKYDIKTKKSWEELTEDVNADVPFYYNVFPFVFQGEEINAEIFGNILYGYSGNAGGFSLSELIFGGDGYSRLDSGEGDNIEDRTNIEKGYGMYENVRRDYWYIHATDIELPER